MFDVLEPRVWFFTFGMDHINPITGKSLGKYYVRLFGTANDTREEMQRRFGGRWSMQYPHADTVHDHNYTGKGAGVNEFGLSELKLDYIPMHMQPGQASHLASS